MSIIIKLLIICDIFVFSGFGLMNPIFAIFIKDNLKGGSIAAAGIAATIYLLTKAILQLPVARWTDKEPANVREFWSLLIGYFLIVLVPFLILFAKSVNHLYLIQFLYGIAAALAYPGWMAIFTKFADHERAAFSWSFYSTCVALAMAISAAIGGWIGQTFGFKILFLIVGVLVFLGFFSTLGLALFYEQLKLVKPDNLRPFHERLWDVFRRHKHPPIPPGKLLGPGDKH